MAAEQNVWQKRFREIVCISNGRFIRVLTVGCISTLTFSFPFFLFSPFPTEVFFA